MKIKETVSAPIFAFVMFSLLLFSRAFDLSSLPESENVYLAIVVLQLVVFILPALVYCKLKGKSYSQKLRLTIPRPESAVAIICAAVVIISGEMLYRILFADALNLSDGFSLYGTYAVGSSRAGSALYLLVAFALIPAICEEFVFRSVMIAEYESCGVFGAVTASSVLFAAMHFDVSRAPIYLFCGIVLSMTLYLTRSTLAAVIVHFLYNMFGMFGQKYINAFYNTTGSEELFVFLLALVFLIFLAVFLGEASRLYDSYAKKNKSAPYLLPKKEKRGKLFEALFSLPYLACILMFVIVTIGME